MIFLIDDSGDFFYNVIIKESLGVLNSEEFHGLTIFWHTFSKRFESRVWFAYNEEIIIFKEELCFL